MQVKVGDISASCPHCQRTEFHAAKSSDRAARLICAGCGNETSRAQLLIQIGDKTARQAAEALARLRQKRSRKRGVDW